MPYEDMAPDYFQAGGTTAVEDPFNKGGNISRPYPLVTMYDNLQGCYGEKNCAEAIMAGAQAVDSCENLSEEWVGTCTYTDLPDCDRQVQYLAYMVGCDAECRRTAPETARYACEGSSGTWADYQ